jgi:formate C-acetyltransferase
MDLSRQEREAGGVLDMDTKIISTITSHGAGYIEKDLEQIVGLQTDKPFKRALQPFGGIRMAQQACKEYGYEVDPSVVEIFTKYRKTHNQGVFDAYTPEMRLARHSAILTGLPDAYGRGRIIGDYRRVALYGIDLLIEDKKHQIDTSLVRMTSKNIRLREELAEQVRALQDLKKLGEIYGFDISKPAANAKEAVQWLYFGYLAAVKEQNGAAMSLGRTSTFLDIFIQRDLDKGILTEEQAQELIDHFIMKLRIVKFARTPEYNELFSGDPTWITESIGGVDVDGHHLVTKNSFRYLHTLENLGTAPEPNMTILWSTKLPRKFKEYCAKMSIKTSSIQYENDDMMRVVHGDDYAIACCVSSMVVGKEMQFFGARANLAKCLLYAINGGVDERLGIQVGPKYRPVDSEYLSFDDVWEKYMDMMEWLAGLYVNTLNIIHYMHDKYSYERLQMALHDRDVKRYFATGIAGLSVVADSLSAIKYAKVKPIRKDIEIKDKAGNVTGVTKNVVVDYEIEGDFPKYGNNDDRVDQLAVEVVRRFMDCVRKHHTYRDSVPTMSILTITSNVVYGKKTGNTPDGRKQGVPLAPGANPMHGRDTHGAVASLSSVAKLPFRHAQDGISNTFSIVPNALGKDMEVFAGDLDLDKLKKQI